MRIAIVLPPGYHTSSPPLSCAHLSSLVPENFEKRVFDFSNDLNAPENILKSFSPAHYSWLFNLNSLSKRVFFQEMFFITLAKISSKNYHPEKFVKKLLDYKPDILLVTVPNQSAFSFSLDIIETYKQDNPNSVVIYGGFFPSNFPNYLIESFSYIDYVFVGEAYPELPNLLRRLSEGKDLTGINGLFFNKNGKAVNTGTSKRLFDLDKLPAPDFSWVNWKDYSSKAISLFLSFGCVNQCSFCNQHALFGKFRTLSNKRIKEILDKLIVENNITQFVFCDSLVNPYKNRVLDLCDLIMSLDFDISWSAYANLKPINKNIAEAMSKSGCESLSIGVESGVDRILKTMHKPHRNSDLDSLRHFLGKEIKINTSWIMGFPTQTKDEIVRDINTVSRLLTEDLIDVCAFNYGVHIDQFNLGKFEDYLEFEPINPAYLEKNDLFERVKNYYSRIIQVNSKFMRHKKYFDDETTQLFKLCNEIEKYSLTSASMESLPFPIHQIQKIFLNHLKMKIPKTLSEVPKPYKDKICLPV